MGIVYRALHVELECEVALKVIRHDLARQDEAAQRMLNEARAAASLRSEHVARVLDVGRTAAGAPFLVMDLLSGEDLDMLLEREGSLAFTTAVDYLLEACEAVAEAHARGIVHRDLKPENLFLATRVDGSPCVKVLDFGVAKDIVRAKLLAVTDPKTLVGSPQYMAPEQMRPSIGPLDHRADIWALGAILYELITGRSPFGGESLVETCHNVLCASVPSPVLLVPELPLELERVMLHCLEKEPSRRFQSVPELAAALAPFASPSHIEYAERAARVASTVRRPETWSDTMSIPAVEAPPSPSQRSLVGVVPGSRPPEPRRPRLVGYAARVSLAAVLALGVAAVVLRAGPDRLAEQALAGAPPWEAAAGQSAVAELALPSPASAAPSSSSMPSVLSSAARLAPLAVPVGAARTRPAGPRAPRGSVAVNPWDRRSFGGRR